MKKIITIIIFLVLIVIVWQGRQLVIKIEEPMQERQQAATAFLKKHVDVKEIIDHNFYHGTESYDVFRVINAEGEKVIIWISADFSEPVIKSEASGISPDEVEQLIENKLTVKKLISVKLGMENTIPLYEISYLDQQDRYAYYFITFKDGTYVKHYYLDQQ